MPTEKTIYETGQEPEYVVDQIVRVEPMKEGLVRLYVASERERAVRVEYTVVISTEKLAEMGRLCLVIAAEAHNEQQLWPTPLETAH